jgi:hypothetical protein
MIGISCSARCRVIMARFGLNSAVKGVVAFNGEVGVGQNAV